MTAGKTATEESLKPANVCKNQNGLVLVSTGVLKFGKPFVDSGTTSSTWNLKLNADDNYELAYAA